MRAIVLAAGVGRRFGAVTKALPKCLVPLGPGGPTLLSRYFDAFRHAGIRDIVIVCGHKEEKVRRHAAAHGRGLRVRFVRNPDYRRGSIVSLAKAAASLDRDVLVMDADVYFPAEALRRLARSRKRDVFLADTLSKSAGEEMMLMARRGRLEAISKRLVPGLEVIGEATGIVKFGTSAARRLAVILRGMVRSGIRDVEYEDAYGRLMKERRLGFERIGGVFWSEMDFPGDLRRIAANLAAQTQPGAERKKRHRVTARR